MAMASSPQKRNWCPSLYFKVSSCSFNSFSDKDLFNSYFTFILGSLDKSWSIVEWKKNTLFLSLYNAIWALDGEISMHNIFPKEFGLSSYSLFNIYSSFLSFIIIETSLIVSLFSSLTISLFLYSIWIRPIPFSLVINNSMFFDLEAVAGIIKKSILLEKPKMSFIAIILFSSGFFISFIR